ncbi:MAG: hypothetical protein JXR86_10810 [Spirochaetales bacterium]|nr:hypothetical protein [Spirochaetales bacterium]
MFTHYAGIDEAALGPVLGPYCAAAVSFGVSESTELSAVFSEYQKLQIGDSKKIFTSGKTPGPLEKTALSFLYSYSETIPENLRSLLSGLNIPKAYLEEIRSIPWYKNLEEYPVPAYSSRKEIEQSGKDLCSFLQNKSLKLDSLIMDVVPARRFNSHLLSGRNKGETCQVLLAPLLRRVYGEKRRITVDRQGGRRYYGEWLMKLFPGSAMAIRKETAGLSEYDIGNSSVRFQVRGDDIYLETALASIFSKYLREMMMVPFNDYWTEKIPDLKRTAGYPQDGKRFIGDLEKAGVPYDRETLIRLK